MTQNIWICRHGNRIDFVDSSWVGDDPHLSPDGVEQAKQTGLRLKGEGIRHIFASPFLRAVETAYYIAEALDLQVKIEEGASEWLNGDWFAARPVLLDPAELAKRFPRIDLEYKSKVMAGFPETAEQSLARAARTSRILVETYDEDMLIIGHGHSVLGMCRGLVGDDYNREVGLCSLAKLARSQDGFSVELAGDCSHLSGGSLHVSKLN